MGYIAGGRLFQLYQETHDERPALGVAAGAVELLGWRGGSANHRQVYQERCNLSCKYIATQAIL